jgi:hypothetical protein
MPQRYGTVVHIRRYCVTATCDRQYLWHLPGTCAVSCSIAVWHAFCFTRRLAGCPYARQLVSYLAVMCGKAAADAMHNFLAAGVIIISSSSSVAAGCGAVRLYGVCMASYAERGSHAAAFLGMRVSRTIASILYCACLGFDVSILGLGVSPVGWDAAAVTAVTCIGCVCVYDAQSVDRTF